MVLRSNSCFSNSSFAATLLRITALAADIGYIARLFRTCLVLRQGSTCIPLLHLQTLVGSFSDMSSASSVSSLAGVLRFILFLDCWDRMASTVTTVMKNAMRDFHRWIDVTDTVTIVDVQRMQETVEALLKDGLGVVY